MKKRSLSLLLALVLALGLLGGCGTSQPAEPEPAEETAEAVAPGATNPATEATAQANAAWYDTLDFDDESEKENALRGLIEAPESLVIYDENGKEVWNVDAYSFLDGQETIPDSINPSLWRNTLYNSYAGLFEVCDGIYQVRGYDMANATFIRTDSGWIVFDVLMCKEDMEQAKALMEKNFGELDIKAVLYSHSHVDHYGGILGLISNEDVADASLSLEDQLASGKVVVLAPEGFLEHAVSENVYAGPAMARRAMYQYGTMLTPGETGKLAMGIGLGQSVGHTGLVAPTYDVTGNEALTIDGLEIQFQLTPGTEAPAEMNAYFPQYRGLWLAENCTGTMHNLYTLRGAEVRDASAWASYILEAEKRFGDETDVVFQSHNWPHWDTENIKTYMENTAAAYQFIHDQTLHYANLGYTSNEIANMIQLPDALNKVWYTRQYYGTLSHNAKAVYQKYLGWYDANPVNLNPLSPEDTAKKWVEYLGDTGAVLEKAKQDYDKGEYQWVAQVTRELVFADPSNQAARNLCADALEQLGYQAESGTWRNAYLSGALELREGNLAETGRAAAAGEENRQSMTAEMMLDYIRICTDSEAAQNAPLSLNLILTDTGESFYLKRVSGVLLYCKGVTDDSADATVTCEKAQLLDLMLGKHDLLETTTVEGDPAAVEGLPKYMTALPPTFNIVEP